MLRTMRVVVAGMGSTDLGAERTLANELARLRLLLLLLVAERGTAL